METLPQREVTVSQDQTEPVTLELCCECIVLFSVGTLGCFAGGSDLFSSEG